MLATGDVVGSYRVVGVLGEGGFATVYRVEHVVLGSTHALKVLAEDKVANPELRSRFLEEARVQARLRHPNIVPVTDTVGEVAGMVMEFVEGETLAVWIARQEKPPAPDVVRAVMLPLLDAVGYAHRAGVVHRDLKPGNVIVTQRGGLPVPHVVDFGIAKVADDAEPRARKHATRAGQRIGTVGYMSPEQIRSPRDVDARTDIFSLGVTLFEVATGDHPFDREGEYDTEEAIVHARYAVPEWLDQRDPPVASAIRRALRVRREDRFPDCEAFAAALLSTPAPDEPRTRAPASPTLAPEPREAPAPVPVRAPQVVVPAVRPPAPPPPPSGVSGASLALLAGLSVAAVALIAALAGGAWLFGSDSSPAGPNGPPVAEPGPPPAPPKSSGSTGTSSAPPHAAPAPRSPPALPQPSAQRASPRSGYNAAEAAVRDGRRLDASALDGLGCEELWQLRNWVYARHGYAFQTERAIRYFRSRDGYRRDPSVTSNTIKRALTDADRANVDRIQAAESAQRCAGG